MKAYTDLKQSKKLAEILPIESADMFWYRDAVTKENTPRIMSLSQVPKNKSMYYSPCWSLAALLNYLREIDFFPNIEADEHSVTMSINYYNEEEARPLAPVHNITTKEESFINACYEMILKLHERKLL